MVRGIELFRDYFAGHEDKYTIPADTGFPFMIELFSRKPDHFLAKADTACVPIHISDEVSSLSAILLDADYYQLLLDGRTKIAGVPILTAERLIPFKAKAWLDLTEKNESGPHIDSRNITKHKNDLYRLSYLLNEEMICELHGEVARDMKIFLEKINQVDDADSPVFKRLKKMWTESTFVECKSVSYTHTKSRIQWQAAQCQNAK